MPERLDRKVIREDLFELVAILDELGVTSNLPMRRVRDRLETLARAA